MAKPATVLIKLNSTADTGFYYVTKKNPRTSSWWTTKAQFAIHSPKPCSGLAIRSIRQLVAKKRSIRPRPRG